MIENIGIMKIENKQPSPNKKPIRFTDRQRNIMKAWAEHSTIATASRELNISEHTFQTHLRRMRKKIEVPRTFEVYEYMKNNQIL